MMWCTFQYQIKPMQRFGISESFSTVYVSAALRGEKFSFENFHKLNSTKFPRNFKGHSRILGPAYAFRLVPESTTPFTQFCRRHCVTWRKLAPCVVSFYKLHYRDTTRLVADLRPTRQAILTCQGGSDPANFPPALVGRRGSRFRGICWALEVELEVKLKTPARTDVG